MQLYSFLGCKKTIKFFIFGCIFMPKQFHLNKRAIGPWTSFECYLLKPENAHVGWIEWIDSRSFRLKKNPFSNHPMSPYIYIVPDEVHIPIEEGLIRIQEEKIIKNVKIPRGKSYGNYTEQICIVAGYEPLKPDELPKPFLKKNDFLNRILYNWESGNTKTFGTELALNILSCPKSMYGIGGIGAQSFAPFGSKQNLLTLDKAIRQLLPGDFLVQNKAFQYKPIKTREEEQKVNLQVRKAVSDEISYNYLFSLSPETEISMMPTQIPIVLPEALYVTNKWELDPDILDYQMGALLIQPHIDERIQEELWNLITKIGSEMLIDIPEEHSVDFTGFLRLAKAWARLQFKWQLENDDFTKMKNDLKEPFKEFFDLVEDAKKIGRTYLTPLTQMSDKKTVSINATKTIRCAKQLEREIGNKRLLKTALRKKILLRDMSDYDFERTLDELVLAGYFLKHKNGTEYDLVI
jgi:hypothetical protein